MNKKDITYNELDKLKVNDLTEEEMNTLINKYTVDGFHLMGCRQGQSNQWRVILDIHK